MLLLLLLSLPLPDQDVRKAVERPSLLRAGSAHYQAFVDGQLLVSLQGLAWGLHGACTDIEQLCVAFLFILVVINSFPSVQPELDSAIKYAEMLLADCQEAAAAEQAALGTLASAGGGGGGGGGAAPVAAVAAVMQAAQLLA